MISRKLWISLLVLLLCLPVAIDARNRKGDKLFAEGRSAELKDQWDEALDKYEAAYATEPSEAMYKIAMNRARFQASQIHLDRGRQLRSEGKLAESLLEFEKALAQNPASPSAAEDVRQTAEMVAEARQREAAGQPALPPETPAEREEAKSLAMIESAQPAPVLKPLSREPITLKINNQTPKVLFETVAKLAGLNVIFDPDFLRQQTQRQDFEVTNATLEEALDYLSVTTKAYWKPLSENTIFVTLDNPTKRRDYQEHITKVFYLKNVLSVQELQEIATAVRSVTDLRKLFTYNSQNAIIVRGPVDAVALAEKIINDLDKQKSEVVVDVLLMEAARSTTRNLGAALVSGSTKGLQLPITFRPQTSTGTGTGTGTTTTSTSSGAVTLGKIGKLSSNDWSLTMPGGELDALMTASQASILQSPQVRSLDGQKAELKIGDRVPIASGSFTAGIGGVGVSPLVNTQFQYIDVGVIVSLTPKIHGTDEVTIHVELEVSTVRERINVGGLEQPVIGQRRVVHDIRIHEGEVNLLGGLIQEQDTKNIAGLPWLSNLPIFGRFFSTENKQNSQSELLIALVPHVVRTPDIKAYNVRGIASGTEQNVQLRFYPPAGTGPQQPEAAAPAAPAAPAPAAPPVPSPRVQPPNAPNAPSPFGAAPPAPQAPGGPGAAFVVGGAAKVGAPLTVDLLVNGVSDLAAAPLSIQFDPQKLILADVTEGDFLKQNAGQTVFTKNIRNDEGRATVNLNRFPGSGGASGSGVLMRFTFQPIQAGEATITTDAFTLRNPRLEQIPAQNPAITLNVQP